jgi:hypothetical protein
MPPLPRRVILSSTIAEDQRVAAIFSKHLRKKSKKIARRTWLSCGERRSWLFGKPRYWRCPAVIEGWALRPEWVQAAKFRDVASLWIEIDEPLVRERLAGDADFIRWSEVEWRLLEFFVAQSVGFNRRCTEAARAAGWRVISAREVQAASWDDLMPSLLALVKK